MLVGHPASTTRSTPTASTTTPSTNDPTTAGPDTPGRAHEAHAVDVGSLVLGPPDGHRRVVVVVLLDEHGDPLADALERPLRGELLDERREPLDPLGDDVVGQLAVELLGLGAVLVGVAEHPDDVEPRLP